MSFMTHFFRHSLTHYLRSAVSDHFDNEASTMSSSLSAHSCLPFPCPVIPGAIERWEHRARRIDRVRRCMSRRNLSARSASQAVYTYRRLSRMLSDVTRPLHLVRLSSPHLADLAPREHTCDPNNRATPCKRCRAPFDDRRTQTDVAHLVLYLTDGAIQDYRDDYTVVQVLARSTDHAGAGKGDTGGFAAADKAGILTVSVDGPIRDSLVNPAAIDARKPLGIWQAVYAMARLDSVEPLPLVAERAAHYLTEHPTDPEAIAYRCLWEGSAKWLKRAPKPYRDAVVAYVDGLKWPIRDSDDGHRVRNAKVQSRKTGGDRIHRIR